MSLKKFLKKVWAAIANIFHKVDDEIKKIIPVVIQIVDNLKLIDDSHIGDVLAAIIPGDVDDKILKKIHETLPTVILSLNIVKGINDLPDDNAKLKAILAAINVSPDDTKKVFYHGLASLILEKLSDGKFDWADAVAVSQWAHDHKDLITFAAETGDAVAVE